MKLRSWWFGRKCTWDAFLGEMGVGCMLSEKDVCIDPSYVFTQLISI